MKRRALRRQLTLLLALLMIFAVSVGSTLCYVATNTAPVENTFVPYQSVGGDLEIFKEVEHPFGGDYVIPENIVFDYQIALGKFYANTPLQTTQGTVTTDENGVLTLTVAPNVPVGILGIDENTVVTVTEIQKDNDGFTPKDDVISKQVTVAATGSVVGFVNVYSPAPVSPAKVTVTGTKALTGRDWQEGDQFSFVLERETEEDVWEICTTETVAYDKNNEEFNQFDFNDVIQALSFSEAGTYSFRIYEVKEDGERITYDETVYNFTVTVTDKDMDGSLEIGAVTSEQEIVTQNPETGEYSLALSFQNVFTPGATPPPTDDFTPYLFAGLMIVALGGVVFVIIRKRRKLI